MNSPLVRIDFELLSKLFQEYVREKAKQFGSTIVYKKGDILIEEDPQDSTQRVLKHYTYSSK
jgi:hypothetical protein